MEFELRSWYDVIVVGVTYADTWVTFSIACGFHDRTALMQPHQMGFNKFTVEARILLFACVFSS